MDIKATEGKAKVTAPKAESPKQPPVKTNSQAGLQTFIHSGNIIRR